MIDAEQTSIVLRTGNADDSTAADVERCLKMLYSAHPGEQALDRDFGIDRAPLGMPTNPAAELVAKTARYEPRVRVLRVEWDESENNEGILIPRVVVEIV